MTFKEAHDKLNGLFPGRSHSIEVSYWQHNHGYAPPEHAIYYTISVHNPHYQVNSAPSLEVGMDELIRAASAQELTKPEFPEETKVLAQAEATAKEMEEATNESP